MTFTRDVFFRDVTTDFIIKAVSNEYKAFGIAPPFHVTLYNPFAIRFANNYPS